MIFCGSGATAAVNKLIGIVELRIPAGLDERYSLAGRIPEAERPVVFVGPYEHHSNELPWRAAAGLPVRPAHRPVAARRLAAPAAAHAVRCQLRPGRRDGLPRRRGHAGEEDFPGNLQLARAILAARPARLDDEPTGMPPEFGALRWFPLPRACLQGRSARTVEIG